MDNWRELPTSETCVVCGRHNPAGLKVVFHTNGEKVRAEVNPPEGFQGMRGLLHGGIITALLDDAMWYAIYDRGFPSITAELTVRFKKAVRLGQPLVVEGWLKEQKGGRLFTARAHLYYDGSGNAGDTGGEILASGEGKFFPLPEELREAMGSFGQAGESYG